ncbi:MAG: hypothetical protein ABIY52_02275 [Gemmatimonadaceae bacterium]
MAPHRAGLAAYLKRAFTYHWNIGLFSVGVVGALLSPWPDAVLPLVGALEALYLGSMVGIPKFREAIDAEAHSTQPAAQKADTSLGELLSGLGLDAQRRFQALRHRCVDMQAIATDLRGADAVGDVAGSMRTSGLNQLLWGFLRLLHHQAALRKLITSMDEADIALKQRQVADGLTKAKASADERLIRSHEERLATVNERLAHYERSRNDLEFVTAELDRIEDKIQALSEMAVNQADPNGLSAQIDATAESMQATESRLSEFQAGTMAIPELNNAPSILDDPQDHGRLRA